jgi:Ricin-type beta-trefoil lectin domain
MTIKLFVSMSLLAVMLFLGRGQTVGAGSVDDRNITINTSDDITVKRQALINFVWGTDGFPLDKLPSSVEQDVPTPVSNLNNLERVDTLNIVMESGETGLAHHFIPSSKNNRLVVFHNGHFNPCTFDDGEGSGNTDHGLQRTINALLSTGFSVLAVYMPRINPNNCQDWHSHKEIFTLPVTTGNPMKFFLESVAVSLNYLQTNYAYRDFSMIGLSGGGWTTTVYAALDPRIRLSLPVAGSVPLYLQNEDDDTEQFLPSFYEIAGYPDLYVLGSNASGRKQIQILNRHDDCCFGEAQHRIFQEQNSGIQDYDTEVRAYEAKVKSSLRVLDSGVFHLYIDEVAPYHMISDNALAHVILPVLNGASHIFTTIRSVAGGNLCVDIADYGRPPQNGDLLQIFLCEGGSNQQFRIRNDGTIHTLLDKNLCFDLPDYGRPPQNGDLIQVFQCNGGPNQQFRIRNDDTIHTFLDRTLCLDLPDYGRPPENGDLIQIFQCNGGSNQRWSVNH